MQACLEALSLFGLPHALVEKLKGDPIFPADVSRDLGKHRAAVWRWIKKFGIDPQKFRRNE